MLAPKMFTLKLTEAEVEALIGACGMAGFGFQYGGVPDPNDPGVTAQVKLEEAVETVEDKK